MENSLELLSWRLAFVVLLLGLILGEAAFILIEAGGLMCYNLLKVLMKYGFLGTSFLAP